MRQDPYAGIAVRKDPARPQQRQPAPQAQDPYAGIAVRQDPPPTRNRQTPGRGQTPPPAPAEPPGPIYAPTPNIPQTPEKREVTHNGRRIVVVGEGAPLDSVEGGLLPDDYVEGDRVWRATPPAAGGAAAEPAPSEYDRFMTGVLAVQPGFRSAAGLVAGGARGLARVAGGAYGLLGQAADRLGLDGIGNAMIDQANAFQGGASRLNAPFRNAALRENQIGQVLGEVAATVPLTAGVGAGVGAVGRGVAAVAPRAAPVGNVISRVGQSISAGGFTPAAVGRPLLERTFVRATGGATAGLIGAGVVGEEGGTRDADLLGMTEAEAGAAIGAFLPTIARRPASFVANRFADGFQMLSGQFGNVRARQIIMEALGGVDPDDAIAAMRNAAPGETATQAMVSAGLEPAAFMAGGALARSVDPDPYLAIDAAQAAALRAPLDRLAGGSNLTAAQLAARGEKEALRAGTVPMQRAALAAADASGAMDVGPVVAALMAQADAPGVRGSANATVLADVAARLDNIANMGGGVPSADDIYTLRREGLDDAITKALSGARGGDISSASARRAKLLRETQVMLDDAIKAAGGNGWQEYLDAYSSGSQAIRRQQMMGVAGRQLRQNPNAFVNTVEGDAPDVVSGVFGPGRIDLASQMNPTGVGPSGMDALTRAAREVRRDERIGVLAREGGGRFGEILAGQDPGRFIGRARNVMAGSAGGPATAMALDVGERLLAANISKQTRAKLAEAYRSGANMRRLLELTPLAERLEVRLALQGLLINSMVSPDEQGNAMAPGVTVRYSTPEDLANSVEVPFPE
jgi:hypothetical protein